MGAELDAVHSEESLGNHCSASISGTTRSRNSSSCARSSATGQRKTRWAPARAYAGSFSAHSSAEPIGRTARRCSGDG